MPKPISESQHALSRLVSRYGPDHGAYLFGELCVLQSLGLEAFSARHPEPQLKAIAEALSPLGLWPGAEAPVFAPSDDRLMEVARSLVTAPLRLAMGIDLYMACADWAAAVPEGPVAIEAWFEPARAALVETLGFEPPPLEVVLGSGLSSVGYRLLVAGEAVLEGEVFLGQDLVLGPEGASPPPLPYAWSRDPAGSGYVAWMPVGPEAEPPAELPRLHALTALSRHLSAALPKYADRLLTTHRVQALLAQAETAGYDHELERYVSVPELRLVFQMLLRQGVALRPIEKLLEGMTVSLVQELAKRKLGQEEIEKLNRQLPSFSTHKLVGFARKALGLPEDPPPAFSWPGPPGPARGTEAAPVDPEAWRELLAEMKRFAPAAHFWVEVYRQSAALDRLRSRVLPWSRVFRPAGVVVPALAIRGRVAALAVEPRVRLALERYVAIARPLMRLNDWLDEPAAGLDAETANLLFEPRFETWRWWLAQPERLAEAVGLGPELEAFRQSLPK